MSIMGIFDEESLHPILKNGRTLRTLLSIYMSLHIYTCQYGNIHAPLQISSEVNTLFYTIHLYASGLQLETPAMLLRVLKECMSM